MENRYIFDLWSFAKPEQHRYIKSKLFKIGPNLLRLACYYFQMEGGFMALPLMPKVTAVWLVENTTLTLKQIADFCGVHPLEV